jgi:hypothetical protein
MSIADQRSLLRLHSLHIPLDSGIFQVATGLILILIPIWSDGGNYFLQVGLR